MLFESIITLLRSALHVVNFVLLGLSPLTGLFRLVFPRPPKRKQVVILGGSFAGLAAQRELSDSFNVTVIDSKKFFEYTPGILRAFVEPSFLKDITCAMPSTRNTFIHATVTHVSPAAVTVKYPDGETAQVPFDYLLVGTGSSYVSPIKCTNEETGIKQRQTTWTQEAQRLTEAASVLVVGAGPVGVELAGEIMTEYPTKKVILVDGATKVCAAFPDASIQYMTKWLTERGCQLELGVSIAGTYPDLDITDTGCELKDGKVLSADVVYRCLGFKANAGFMSECFGDNMDRGRIVVNEHLQIPGHPTIFAMGDCMIRESEMKGGPRDLKLGHTAELNAHLICKNVVRHLAGDALKSYPRGVTGGIPTPIIYCVSLGKYDATLGMNWLVVNGFVSAVMKWLLEWTKMMAMKEQPVGILFWQVSDFMSMFLARTVLKA